MMHSCVIETPIGQLKLTEQEQCLASVQLTDEAVQMPDTPLLCEAASQLQAYFAGTLRAFDLPLYPAPTPFQQRIREGMCSVPYGATISYAELAERAGNPKACRAAGHACHINPLMIIVPCHRIVGTGNPGGYAYGLDMKNTLLSLEKMNTKKA